MDLIKKIRSFIEEKNLIEAGEKIIVGFSGGPDSVFLLSVLLKLKDEYKLELSLAHINHLLRGEESDGDEEFARRTAQKLGIPVYIRRESMQDYAKKNRMGDEEAGREIRYGFFEEILEKTGADKVALAHNLDDEVETFMFRLMRGTSLNGLEGIPVKRDRYIRPVLNLYKDEIMGYLHRNNIEYRVDSSNLKSDYTRNSIRLELIPEIEKKYNNSFKEKIASLMEEIREANRHLSIDHKIYLDEGRIDLEKLNELSEYEKRMVLREYLTSQKVEVSRKKLDLIMRVISAGGSKEISLGKNLKVKKEYSKLYVSVNSESCKNEVLQTRLEVPGEVRFGNYNIKAAAYDGKNPGRKSFIVDIPAGSEFTIRRRQAGDRITISEDGITKKVKEIFINSKTPKELRDKIPIVTLGEEIIWIVGVRGSELHKAKRPDENSIKLTVEEGNFSERGQK